MHQPVSKNYWMVLLLKLNQIRVIKYVLYPETFLNSPSASVACAGRTNASQICSWIEDRGPPAALWIPMI